MVIAGRCLSMTVVLLSCLVVSYFGAYALYRHFGPWLCVPTQDPLTGKGGARRLRLPRGTVFGLGTYVLLMRQG